MCQWWRQLLGNFAAWGTVATGNAVHHLRDSSVRWTSMDEKSGSHWTNIFFLWEKNPKFWRSIDGMMWPFILKKCYPMDNSQDFEDPKKCFLIVLDLTCKKACRQFVAETRHGMLLPLWDSTTMASSHVSTFPKPDPKTKKNFRGKGRIWYPPEV